MKHEERYTNRLIGEHSPYLLLHAHNPVDWYPWGEEAFLKAKTENKLMIISIGYAACHWCHVMERETFSDTEAAKLMNEHFVAVKVDREERPDIDQVYMEAAQLINGQGGWPLNALALPDGRPVYAATYFQTAAWMEMLMLFHREFRVNREKLTRQAEEIHQGIVTAGDYFIRPTTKDTSNPELLRKMVANWMKEIDFEYGGSKRIPKFPMPAGYDFLLHYHHLTDDLQVLQAVTVTLDRMAMGGIYDHAGGGFARYSTDRFWKVPHFEKMLYDNAQLLSLYANAFRFTGSAEYRQVLKETASFVSRELSSPDGAFYSALDADSNGEEGQYYLWTCDEIGPLLKEYPELAGYYNLTQEGNWHHGRNILFRTMGAEDFCRKEGLQVERFNRITEIFKAGLLMLRKSRVRPLTDTKIITSWNALMIQALAEVTQATGEPEYLDSAVRAARFILEKLSGSDGSLYRNYKDGASYTPAMLEDYACLIRALITLYQSTFDEEWLYHAVHFTEYTFRHFQDQGTGLFYFTSSLEAVVLARKHELADHVMPSSNSVMAMNLYLLGTYFGKDDWLGRSLSMLRQMEGNLVQAGPHFAHWAKLYLLFWISPHEVAITGRQCHDRKKELHSHYLPHVILSGGKADSRLPLLQHKFEKNHTRIFVCRNKTCDKPVSTVVSALGQLNRQPSGN